jgi:hypothetical protein
MSDGVNIDWGLIKQPDYVGDYANAFQVGRTMAQAQAPAAPPSVNAFTTGAPWAPAAPTAPPAPTSPEDMSAHIASLDAAGRARAAEQADLLASLGTGLRAYPYAQRPSILAHLAPALIARGAPPEALAGFDPTNEALDGVIGQARIIGEGLANAGG